MQNEILTSKKTFTLVREFDAPRKEVFNAFADADALNEWWGPAETENSVIKLDFRPGGIFHFKMKHNGKVNYGRFLFAKIQPYELLEFSNAFADENAKVVKAPFDIDLPAEIFYRLVFTEHKGKTTLTLTGSAVNPSTAEQEAFESINADMHEGFSKTFNKLDLYIATQKQIHRQLKTSNMARVTTYLNFPGNTEEAFNFYKSVFDGEFTGVGLQRFGEAKLPAEVPPLSDADKKLILHAELTIMGGHVLMATDAPESMGFKLTTGNNMHINVEPETRNETKRLFDALSKGGIITMPLEDMFFGAYFGSCTDKYGINWMFTCTEGK
jgi:uncharacterized glyoxalase superfamily protein PhnB/uncharacterized protein YndB with AHSA1/START domain